jgi:hypothetical protein
VVRKNYESPRQFPTLPASKRNALTDGEEIIEVWEKDSSGAGVADLMNRAELSSQTFWNFVRELSSFQGARNGTNLSRTLRAVRRRKIRRCGDDNSRRKVQNVRLDNRAATTHS